jgi:hypothetical protein
MYVTSQVVHVTEDQGHSFEIISPDLSEMIQKLQEKRGPITKDQTGAEVYATIFTLRIKKGVIWTGSDDSLSLKRWGKMGEYLITNNTTT